MRTINISGSHGVIEALEDGTVLNVFTHEDPTLDEGAFHYHAITHFDFKEYESFYGEPIPDYVDILDVCYTYLEEPLLPLRVPADPFHRQMINEENETLILKLKNEEL